jgi:hypothetical protein
MHMHRNWFSGVPCSLIFVLLLTGCSSGGGDDAPPAAITGTAEGLWTGTTGNGRTVLGAVLDDDTYWFFYSAIGRPSVFAGVVHGAGHSQGGAFSSPRGMDFNIEPNVFGDGRLAISGSYLPGQRLEGILAYFDGGSVSVNLAPAPEAGAPDLAQVAGTYPGQGELIALPSRSTVMILPSGRVCFVQGPLQTVDAVTGEPLPPDLYDTRDRLCEMLGTLTPRAQGHVYDLSLVNRSGYGYTAVKTYTGVAILDPETGRLWCAAVNAADSADAVSSWPFLAVGTKQ